MRKQAKKREIYDQDLQETNDEESEIDLNESKLKNPSENSGKNCDKVATIIYNMILKNVIFVFKKNKFSSSLLENKFHKCF